MQSIECNAMEASKQARMMCLFLLCYEWIDNNNVGCACVCVCVIVIYSNPGLMIYSDDVLCAVTC